VAALVTLSLLLVITNAQISIRLKSLYTPEEQFKRAKFMKMVADNQIAEPHMKFLGGENHFIKQMINDFNQLQQRYTTILKDLNGELSNPSE